MDKNTDLVKLINILNRYYTFFVAVVRSTYIGIAIHFFFFYFPGTRWNALEHGIFDP